MKQTVAYVAGMKQTLLKVIHCALCFKLVHFSMSMMDPLLDLLAKAQQEQTEATALLKATAAKQASLKETMEDMVFLRCTGP